MTGATVTVAVCAALFLATASAVSSRFVFEAREQRFLRNSAQALSEAVRREIVEENVPLKESAQDSIFESGLADDAIEIWKGEARVATSRPGTSIGLSPLGVVVTTPSWFSITVLVAEDVRLVVASPRDAGERAWSVFGWSLLLATPLSILTAILVGRREARKLVEPLLSFRDRIVSATPQKVPQPGRPEDPDEVREIDSAFRSQWQRLRDSLDREHDFAANAAHELRTPLTRLGLLAERVREGGGEGEGVALLQLEEIERMSSLVDALLVLARTAELPSDGVETVNLSDVLRDSTTTWRQAPHIQAPDEAMVRGDENLLRIAVLNLLDNARKFGPRAEPPAATVEIREGRVRLQVTTPGARIGVDQAARVFDRFHRGPEARAEQKGHGLGLSLARHIARLHRGDVTLVSTHDEDVRFLLDLPAWIPR